jgi:hypothetical protein
VNTANSGLYYELYEFDFNKSRPVPMLINECPTNQSWGVALRPQMNITVSNPDGANMTISWSSNSSGSWQLFGTNSSIGNGTYHQLNNNFSTNNTKYWWKVSVSDGTDSNSSWFYFSTPDFLKPSSNVVAITPYWKKSSITITAAASDTGWSGVKNVTLYSRFSSDNASWGGWVNGGVDTASPWSWSFAFSNSTGYYQFYSIAKDYATNAESVPGAADTKTGYDAQAPSSLVSAISGYWKTSSSILITATASNLGPSGLKNVTLYYRYRTTNESSWSSNLSYDVVITPWVSCSWSFSFPNGSGNYQFYCIAKDNATNAESAPSSVDTECGFDTQAPTSSVNVISPYWEKDSTSISATATDPLSGVKNVTLYGDLGYLIDNDSDGTYDSFRFNPTGRITLSEIKNGKYLIDADGDNIMDYQYDPMSGTIISIHQPPSLTEEKPFSPFLLIGGLILIIVIIATIVISRRRFSKK